MSRRKGKAGEREVAALIRDVTGLDCQRRVRQHDGDSDLLGVPGWSIEVKRYGQVGRADIIKWYRQAVEQAKAEFERPVLFYRRDKDSWRAVWPMKLDDPESWASYIYTVEGTVEAWANVVMEMGDGIQIGRAGSPFCIQRIGEGGVFEVRPDEGARHEPS
ncbi:MAG: hypothetical protein ACK5SP_02195 [bacterium]|jgi:hypothetical protein